jgi:hypothetical protein
MLDEHHRQRILMTSAATCLLLLLIQFCPVALLRQRMHKKARSRRRHRRSRADAMLWAVKNIWFGKTFR